MLYFLWLIPATITGQPEPIGVWTMLHRLEQVGHNSTGHKLTLFLDSLSGAGLLPFVTTDSVLFVFEGADTTTEVAWAGDFNGWNAESVIGRGTHLPGTNLWTCALALPADARIDYKVVADGQWILDPRNPRVQHSGWGPNSVISMPGYVVPPELKPQPDRSKGRFESHCITASAMSSDYRVSFQVYLPAGSEAIGNLPVCYVLDGHEYADSLKGSMTAVVDYLTKHKRIRPLVVVFIDPRRPGYPEQNRRMTEYAGNSRYIDFLADELVPFIDSVYRTDHRPSSRAIMGTSMGGWLAASAGLQRSDCFGNLVLHSPAFDDKVIRLYGASPMLKLSVFVSTGVFFDTQERASELSKILIEKGYSIRYREVNQGHSWGNWKGLISEPLEWMFPPIASPSTE